jgi:Mrp family chromosome partitioning ATPase
MSATKSGRPSGPQQVLAAASPSTSGVIAAAPAVVAARGVPLPLVTQPLQPIAGLQTHVDLPPGVDPALTIPGKNGEGPVLIQRSMASALPSGALRGPAKPDLSTVVASATPRPVAGPPPEIGLTQHHLPGDERRDPRLMLVIDPDSERSAAFRVLRHHLLELGRPQVVIVSSAREGEGKTTTAANLAIALAECGRAKVLLAETHVRRPQLASMFRCLPPWCFAEQLAAHRHQPMLPWNLVEIPQLWLHLAAINPRIEKTQLLDAPAFSIAMERLRHAGYDHIVIDAPPVLGSADVNLMADAADTIVLAVRARTTTTRDLRHAIDQVGASKVGGTVLVE